MDSIQIYKDIKKKIIWLELEPESILNLTDLAQSFNVSRTPISNALIRLEAEGWLVRHGTHFMVGPLSLDRIKQFTEIRLLMEVQANIWAMQRITPEELVSLQALKKEILDPDSKLTPKDIVMLDVKLHQQIFRATKNKELAQILNRLLNHYLRFFLSIPNLIRQELFPELVGMIEAIENKDEEKLRKLSIEHIQGTSDKILNIL